MRGIAFFCLMFTTYTLAQETFNTDISTDFAPRSLEQRSAQKCTTRNGQEGTCEDLSSCPYILLDFSHIRSYLCFRIFFPGVCCPIKTNGNNETTEPPAAISTSTVPAVNSGHIKDPKIIWNRPAPTTKATTTIAPTTTTSTTFLGCGSANVVTTRVVGGLSSVQGQWPWMAAVYLETRRGREYWCGGTLINRQYILTAAHCVFDSRQRRYRASQFTVRLGDANLNSRADDTEKPIELKVQEIKSHEAFRLRNYYNDIALLKLASNVTFQEYIQPLCVPDESIKKENLMGQFATVVGWGATAFGGQESGSLQYVELPIWDNSDCDEVYKQDIDHVYICAGLADGGKDACQGDSGSPLMIIREGHWTQIGIVSFGTQCAQPGVPGVYTRVTEYLEWIAKNAV